MPLAFAENNKIIQYPISSTDLQKKFPNTSFFLPLEGQNLETFGVVSVENTQQPSFDNTTHYLEEGPLINDNGVWKQTWNLIELSIEEKSRIEDNKKASVRIERNMKLSASDWTQLQDAKVDRESWAKYRQDLRDITNQSRFPYDVIWPEKPKS